MASKAHNFIVSSLIRKIRIDGFDIIYMEGNYQDVSIEKYNIPPTIINHRPDVVGIKHDKSFCIGEAKTKYDLSSQRTKNQIKDFHDIISLGNMNKLYIGIPGSAKSYLNKLLDNLHMSNYANIEIICIPDELLNLGNEIQF